MRLRRLVRYLACKPRLVWNYNFEAPSQNLDVYCDTDFGGCMRTRRSTSGGVASLGSHVLKAWSTTQTIVALSPAEAELTGLCRGGACGDPRSRGAPDKLGASRRLKETISAAIATNAAAPFLSRFGSA